MVYIEALIMEVNTNKDFKLGVEWRGVKDTGAMSGIDREQIGGLCRFRHRCLSGQPLPLLLPRYRFLDFPAVFPWGLSAPALKSATYSFPPSARWFRLIRTDTDVSILSTPQIMTLDNEEAEINVGSNVPYITRQDSTSTTAAYPVNYNTYEYKDVGVILNITPHINEENFIRLKISQQVTKVTSGRILRNTDHIKKNDENNRCGQG